jgi:hypothetical protein
MWLVLLDAFTTVMDILRFICLELSIIFTVWWDPLNLSHRPIACGDIQYVIGANNEYCRRIVAWFYRWNEVPDKDDWINCLKRFGLEKCPDHHFFIVNTCTNTCRTISMKSIDLNERGHRLLYLNGFLVDEITVPIGGFVPARIFTRIRPLSDIDKRH